MTLSDFTTNFPSNPLDMVELVAVSENWTFDRTDEHELDLEMAGAWGSYAVSVHWREDLEALHVAAELNLKVTQERREVLVDLLALINEQLFLGHFDLWSDENVILFRYGLLLGSDVYMTASQCERLFTIASSACDRFFPAFQYVLIEGKTPKEALSAALFDTQGQA